MIKIKYLNSQNFIEVEFEVISDHVCYIIGNNKPNSSGFLAYDEDGTLLGDWSDYRTVYRVLDDGIQYSNDGSIYVEPTKNVTVTISFDKGISTIPEALIVLLHNVYGDQLEVVVNQSNGWKKIVENLPIAEYWEILESEDIPDCHYSINEFEITYHENGITWQETIEAQVFYTAMITDTLIDNEEE